MGNPTVRFACGEDSVGTSSWSSSESSETAGEVKNLARTSETDGGRRTDISTACLGQDRGALSSRAALSICRCQPLSKPGTMEFVACNLVGAAMLSFSHGYSRTRSVDCLNLGTFSESTRATRDLLRCKICGVPAPRVLLPAMRGTKWRGPRYL